VADGIWRVSNAGDPLRFTYSVEKVVPEDPGRIPWAKSNDVAVFSDELCAVIIASYLLVYPDLSDFDRISLEFDVPDEWIVVCPHPREGDEYVVQARVGDPIADLLADQEIYMGVMKYYTEVPSTNTTVKLGTLEADDYGDIELRTPAEVDEYAQVAAVALARWEEFFGADPPPVYVLTPNFKRDHEGEWLKWRVTAGLNGMQYWNPHRWDEFLGHAFASWAMASPAPMLVEWGIALGIFQGYFSQTFSWELFDDPIYLAKRYLYYLMYDWMYEHHDRPPESYSIWQDEYDACFRWEFIGMLLDETIQERSAGAYTLEDAVRWMYGRYAGTGVKTSAVHLEQAIETSTGVEISDVFSLYVYCDAELPVYSYIAENRQEFVEQAHVLEAVHGHNYMHGHITPWFVNLVMAAALGEHLVHALQDLEYAVDVAEIILADYSLDSLTEEDIVDVLSDESGVDCSRFFTHWEDSFGRLPLDDFIAWLEDYSMRGNVVTQLTTYSPLGRGEMWGDATAGDILWDGALVESTPIELSIVVHDPAVVSTSSAGVQEARFGVEFWAENGWGRAIMDVEETSKTVFSHQYDDANATVKYFEKVQLPLVHVAENRWEGSLRILPSISITRFTVGEGEAAFGVNVQVEAAE